MKIAVTYEGGSIFQHFGKTETFKMYEVEDGKITSMQIVHAGGAGHSALAGFLSEQSANVLICGGIGDIDTQIICASVRNPMHVTECALAGADIATVPYKVIEQMTHHPLTDAGIAKFQADYKAVFGE